MPVSYKQNGRQCKSQIPKLDARLSVSLNQIQIKISKKRNRKKNLKMEESSGLSSMKFFSDQHLSYADILLPHEVSFASNFEFIESLVFFTVESRSSDWNRSSLLQARARIEVSVLNLLRILNSPDPAISDLSLVLLNLVLKSVS